ncbi:methyltransferase-like protein 14-like protein [Anopheles sinensis]|uniref:Methyltransferase-like protein 14-like protein n=1 Tax=Anopheles sinensis TaxID=74873 RepID=A0A084VFT2_ANOSI|nr:methyltransferase-like protein 14-like protein [Anopheles sinensis]
MVRERSILIVKILRCGMLCACRQGAPPSRSIILGPAPKLMVSPECPGSGPGKNFFAISDRANRCESVPRTSHSLLLRGVEAHKFAKKKAWLRAEVSTRASSSSLAPEERRAGNGPQMMWKIMATVWMANGAAAAASRNAAT